MSKGTRWTLLLMAGVTALAIAVATFRGGGEEEKPVRRPPLSVYGSYESQEPTTAPVAVEPVPPPAPVESRKPAGDVYREAHEATWEGSLSGQVMSPEGPLAGFSVSIEWVLARRPDRDEAAKLKRGGARRDRDGTWWGRAVATTDDSGCFTVEGLPAVPLRVHAGSAVQQAQVGTFARLQTERPQ